MGIVFDFLIFPGHAKKLEFLGFGWFYHAQNGLEKIPDTSGRIRFDIDFYGPFVV